nr:Myosin-9 like [Ipomoea batatas]
MVEISYCLQAGTVLDTVEHLVEEQSLDPLSSEKTNIEETGQYLSEMKKNEINYLMGMLEKAEEQKRRISSRLEFLKKEKQEFSGATDFVDKLRTGTLSYSTGNNP